MPSPRPPQIPHPRAAARSFIVWACLGALWAVPPARAAGTKRLTAAAPTAAGPMELPAPAPVAETIAIDSRVIPRVPSGPLLAGVLADGLVGPPLDGDAANRLRAQITQYLDLRRGRGGARAYARVLAACGADATYSPFCAMIQQDEARRKQSRDNRYADRALSALARQARVQAQAGKLDRLTHFPETALNLAFKGVADSGKIRRLAEGALAQTDCPSSALLASLAQRTEKDFPLPQAKTRALALYARAIQCGDDVSMVKSAYRAGLLKIWEGQFAEADALLERAAGHHDGADYRQRALYWRHYCATQLHNPSLRAEMSQKLQAEFPLSVHAFLSAAADQPPGDASHWLRQPALSPSEPAVQFRSDLRPGLNPVLRAAEILQATGSLALSADLVAAAQAEIRGAEPAVQLYAAVLLMRAGEFIRKLPVMVNAFRENPAYITRTTLEMLYPKFRFEILEEALAHDKSREAQLDPYFVLSVIRQESAFNVRARSRSGAVGLMQLMPRTARLVRGVSRSQLLDPSTNVAVGVKFVSQLLRRYSGSPELALAAYNAGPERVDEWKHRYPIDNPMLFVDLIPYRETREYVASIARNYFLYLRLYQQESMSGPTNRLPATGRAVRTGLSQFSLFDSAKSL